MSDVSAAEPAPQDAPAAPQPDAPAPVDAAATPEARNTRTCDGCGQTDDHPHHVWYGAVTFEDPVTGETVTEDRTKSRHLDCCNCEHCTIVLGTAAGKKGDDLVAHITSKPPELHAALRAAGYDVED